MGKEILVRIGALLALIVAFGMGTNIATANNVIMAGNITNIIGLSAIGQWGSALAVLGIVSSAGLLVGFGNRAGGMGDVLAVIGASILSILGFTAYGTTGGILANINSMIAADANGQIIYGAMGLIGYVVIMGVGGFETYKEVQSIRGRNWKGQKKESSSGKSPTYVGA